MKTRHTDEKLCDTQMKNYVEIHNCIENNWIFNILGKPMVLEICKSGNERIKQRSSWYQYIRN